MTVGTRPALHSLLTQLIMLIREQDHYTGWPKCGGFVTANLITVTLQQQTGNDPFFRQHPPTDVNASGKQQKDEAIR